MALKSGIDQRRVGDEFEFKTLELVKDHPVKFGIPAGSTELFACRTEGSRGEVDIVALHITPQGEPVVTMIQAKRNGYVPPEEREKMQHLLDRSKTSPIVTVFLSHYITKSKWRVTQIRRASDLLNIRRVRDWDEAQKEADVIADAVVRERKDADFEMAVVNTIKQDMEGTLCKTFPALRGYEPFFIIRLEEQPGEPHIICLAAKDGNVAVIPVYAYREQFIPDDQRAGCTTMCEAAIQCSEQVFPFIAFYVHGKHWRFQHFNSEERHLRRFYYM